MSASEQHMIHQDRPVGREGRGPGVWPYVLIGLGLILLLENVGLRTGSFWRALALWWPFIPIVIGADLLLRPFAWGRQLTVLLGVAAVLLIGIWTFARPGAIGLQRETLSVPRSSAGRAEIQLSLGVGRLELRSGTGDLVEGTLELRGNERLERDVRQSGGVDFVRLEARQTGPSFTWGFGPGTSDPRWDLKLAQGVPLSLRVNTGVGESRLDLSGLSLNDLNLNSGVGQTSLVLPASGQFNVRVESGVGETSIRIPEGLAARVRATSGLGSVEVRGPYTQTGDVYTSTGFESATNRVELEVKGGIGKVVVEQGR